jgi:Lon protease-like protein
MTAESQIPLPAEAPIMVLAGCVLFPGTMLPLRIFEPRYRAMLEWALEHERMFCVATVKPGIEEAETVDQFHHVAGIGLVRASVTQSDGTSNLLLHGLARVRFTDFVQAKPFRVARVEAIPSITGSETVAETLAAEIRELCARLQGDEEQVRTFIETLSKMEDAGLLADFVASAFIRDPFERQVLLEERDVNTRLRRLKRHLQKELGPG